MLGARTDDAHVSRDCFIFMVYLDMAKGFVDFVELSVCSIPDVNFGVHDTPRAVGLRSAASG